METRKRLYKATNLGLTMTERVKKDKNRQIEMRNNRFAANRKIDVDEETTPVKAAPIKLSQIKNKPEKLKAYIEQKRTTKLKEKVEQRSPFIPYVPVGRWVERKEPLKKPKAFTISTPIKNALMSDGKILKKSTIKQIATTARKENATTIKKSKKEEPVKSRKKILTEFNNVPQIQAVESAQSHDDTFEIISENLLDDSVIEIKTPQKSPLPTIPKNVLTDEISEPTEIVEDKQEIPITVTPVKKSSPVVEKKIEIQTQTNKELNQLNEKKMEVTKQRAKIVVPVKRPIREKKPANSVESKQVKEPKKKVLKSKSVQESISKDLILPANVPEVQEEKIVIAKSVPLKVQSSTYKFYKSSLDNQVAYISIQLKAFTNNLENFINKLPEDMQNNIHQTIQQGTLLINDKMKGFGDLLEKFENSSEPKTTITEEDIDNYWMMLFDQVEDFKSNLKSAQEAKVIATKDENKRRTRKTIFDTPTRRSRRIAETGDTPRHNAATCFGCTPLSASKVNTPKSAKARRTAFKKSIAFDEMAKQ